MEGANEILAFIAGLVKIVGPLLGSAIVLFGMWLWAGRPPIIKKKEQSKTPEIEAANGGNGKTKSLPTCALHPVFALELQIIKERLEAGDKRFDGVADDIGEIKVNVGRLLERTEKEIRR